MYPEPGSGTDAGGIPLGTKLVVSRAARATRLVLVISLLISAAWLGLRPQPAAAAAASDFTTIRYFAISPSGTKIAFSVPSSNPWGEVPGLYVADRDGANAVRLADEGFSPDFSPDGQHIVFSMPAGPSGLLAIYIVDVGAGVAVELMATPNDNANPRYSPDGQSVVVTSYGGSGPGIDNVTVVDIASQARTVLVTQHSIRDAAFTNDGTALLVSKADDASRVNIYQVPLNHDPETQLTHFDVNNVPAMEESSRSSANPGQIIFSVDNRIMTMNADGSALTEVPSLSGANPMMDDVHWTPGGRVAYLETTDPAVVAPPSSTTPPTTTPPTTAPAPVVLALTGPPGPPSSTPQPTTTAPSPTPTTMPPPESRPRAHLVIPSDPTAQDVPAGGSVSTAPEATPLQPVATTTTSPNPGHVTVDTVATDAAAPSGYSFLGEQVMITAPAATAAAPLTLTFRIDASLLAGSGVTAASVVVFRDGAGIANCDQVSSAASPDPCVAARSGLPDGDAEVIVQTSHASRWNFGRGAAIVTHPTTTTVSCEPATVVVAETSNCTVSVTDAAAANPNPPPGTVSITTADSHATLGTSGMCTLTATGPRSTACVVTYKVSQSPAAGQTDSLAASYSPGDGIHLASTGTGSVKATLRAVNIQISCSPSTTNALRRRTTCTASVGDASAAGTPSVPAGSIRFTSSDGRTDIDPATCTLSPAVTPAVATASCRVSVTPGLAILRSRSDVIVGTFMPTATDFGVHAAGSATTTVVVTALLR
ncbi:MAG: hypothetical protein QOF81_1780 [Acidimicrobiaceae bacterium]|nr:hypothetical protein [Acidimicrobiaceae bacterium]